MKTGAGEDPFADETDDEGADGADASASTGDGAEATDQSGGDGRPGGGRSTGDRPADVGSRDRRSPGARDRRTAGDRGRDQDRGRARGHDADGRDDGDGRIEPSDLPYIARRNARGDNVKAGRDTRRLFELRPEIAEREEPFMEELARELGREVPKTDAREAALAVVYDRPGLVAEKLEEWGVNYFEE